MKAIMIILLALLGIMACRKDDKNDKDNEPYIEKPDVEKILGTWIGYKGYITNPTNTDTFIFTSRTFTMNRYGHKNYYPKYNLHADTLIAFMNDTDNIKWQYQFINPDSLILDPISFTHSYDETYLKRKK